MVSQPHQVVERPTVEAASVVRVALESALPDTLPVGVAMAVFCYGHCFGRHATVGVLELEAGGQRLRVAAFRMPRPDLYEWLSGPHGNGADPERRSFRSGFWTTLPIGAQPRPGTLTVSAIVRLAGSDQELVRPLGDIEIVAPSHQHPAAVARPAQEDSPANGHVGTAKVAVCMATFEPNLALFGQQLASLRDQTDSDWECVISDGGSSPQRFAEMLTAIGDDPRFAVSRSDQRLGPYRNFERALKLAPADADLIALSDQDDRWYPDKLATLRAALGDAELVYSDQRLVDERGGLLRDSLWHGRRNDCSNLASLLVANTVPGAAMLFRREVAMTAVPFPELPGLQFHDHWLALVALARGRIAYVDRALYDYVQHDGAVSADVAGTPAARARQRRFSAIKDGLSSARRRGVGARSRGWRGAYFGGFVPREVQAQTLLMRCDSELTPGKQRALMSFCDAGRRPEAFLWLGMRPLRRWLGHGETLGGETALVKGILWRWLIGFAAAGARAPGRRRVDASFPDPPRFEQRRLRRWRATGRG